ncbi:hypothetical protein HG530_001589 [Fusarium avenaceum]|nr:hypothetical protein HG530_001589 [Fusarium avenaceum]
MLDILRQLAPLHRSSLGFELTDILPHIRQFNIEIRQLRRVLIGLSLNAFISLFKRRKHGPDLGDIAVTLIVCIRSGAFLGIYRCAGGRRREFAVRRGVLTGLRGEMDDLGAFTAVEAGKVVLADRLVETLAERVAEQLQVCVGEYGVLDRDGEVCDIGDLANRVEDYA